MDNAQDKEKLLRLDGACALFRDILKSEFGIGQYAVAVIVPVSNGHELRTNMNGNSLGAVNLVAGLAQQLTPDDFRMLLAALATSPEFAYHRETEPDKKKQMVN